MKQLMGVVAFVCLLLSEAHCQSPLTSLAGESQARSVVAPLYTDPAAGPAAVVRVGRVYTDYATKGFFRIGVLPVSVFDDVTVEILRPDSAARALARVHDWINDSGSERIELRQVKFRVAARAGHWLEAGRARLRTGGCLDLFDGVRLEEGTNVVRAPRATLDVTGRNSGRLILQTSPPRTNYLFGALRQPSRETVFRSRRCKTAEPGLDSRPFTLAATRLVNPIKESE